MEYTEADYIVAKLSGKLRTGLRLSDGFYHTNDHSSSYESLGGKMYSQDVEAFEEWKARQATKSKEDKE